MTCWLTTHYPHIRPDHPWWIYLKAACVDKADQISVGDRVAFYELKGIDKNIKGRQAIVAFGKVSKPIQRNDDHREGGENEGDEVWDWEIPCDSDTDLPRVVSKMAVFSALGWPPNKPPLIACGIMKVSYDVYDSLAQLAGLRP